MKTKISRFTRFVGSLCLLIAYLGMGQLLAQPVVKVPNSCYVAVAGTGTGAAVGWGTKVGNGGIVIMPDPFDDATINGDFTIFKNGTTVTSAGLNGDLSFQTTNTPPAAPLQSLGSPNTMNIESYNKRLRSPSESSTPSTGVLARSKGRVRLNYVSGPCGSFMEFDVLKQYPNTGTGPGYVPPIIGPDCWTPNTLVTYSVDAIATDNMDDAIGVDKYYWQVTDGSTFITSFYNSSDRSSITFRTPAVINGAWEIKCCYGRSNPWDGEVIPFSDHTTCEVKVISAPIADPIFGTAPPSCLNTGLTTVSASVNPVVGLTYVWSVTSPAPCVVTATGTLGQNVQVTGLDNNPCTLVLSIMQGSGSCPPRIFRYPINRNFVGITATASSTCVQPGNTFTVSLPANAMNNQTTWTVPPGWTFSPNNAASSAITVTVPANATGGAYPISGASTLCTGTAATTVNVKPLPSAITGPNCVTFQNTGTLQYSVSVPGSGPYSYTWTLPSGWTGATNSPTINVTPSGTSVGTISVNVCIGTCCSLVTKAVSFNPVTPVISGPPCINVGMAGTAQFTVTNAIAGTYNWTVDPQFGTSTTTTGTTITVNTLGNPGSFPNAVSVTHVTPNCGSSTTTFFPVTLPQAQSGNIQLSLGPVQGSPPNQAQLLLVTGYTGTPAFVWLKHCGQVNETVCNGCGNGNSVTLTDPDEGGSYGVLVIQGACTTRVCTTTTLGHRLMGTTEGVEGIATSEDLRVSLAPNPNDGTFEIQVPPMQQGAEMIIHDGLGQRIYAAPLQAGKNRFTEMHLAAGTYFVYIVVDGKITVKKMDILHR